MHRFIAFSSLRLRRQKRAVRFQQQPVERNDCRRIAQILRLRIGQIAGEGDIPAEIQSSLRFLDGAAEAMEDADHSSSVFLDDRESIGPRLATVNHHRQVASASDVELDDEGALLICGADFLPVIVEADLPDADHLLRMLIAQLFHGSECDLQIVGGHTGMSRVNPDHGMTETLVFHRQLDDLATGLFIDGDVDDGDKAGIARALDHLVTIVIEAIKVEVGMAVDRFCWQVALLCFRW